MPDQRAGDGVTEHDYAFAGHGAMERTETFGGFHEDETYDMYDEPDTPTWDDVVALVNAQDGLVGCDEDGAMHDNDEIEAEIRRLLGDAPEHPENDRPQTTTDKPRRIVVCHPDRYDDVQKAVTKLGYGDVLVKANRYLPDVNTAYVMDPPPEVIEMQYPLDQAPPWINRHRHE